MVRDGMRTPGRNHAVIAHDGRCRYNPSPRDVGRGWANAGRRSVWPSIAPPSFIAYCVPLWDWVGLTFIRQSARPCMKGNWRSRFAPLTCDGLHPAGTIHGISSSSLTIAQTSSRPMLRYSFGWPRDAIGSTMKRQGRPHPLLHCATGESRFAGCHPPSA